MSRRRTNIGQVNLEMYTIKGMWMIWLKGCYVEEVKNMKKTKMMEDLLTDDSWDGTNDDEISFFLRAKIIGELAVCSLDCYR